MESKDGVGCHTITSGLVHRPQDGAQSDERFRAHLHGPWPWHLAFRRGKAYLVLETGEPLGLILTKVLVARCGSIAGRW